MDLAATLNALLVEKGIGFDKFVDDSDNFTKTIIKERLGPYNMVQELRNSDFDTSSWGEESWGEVEDYTIKRIYHFEELDLYVMIESYYHSWDGESFEGSKFYNVKLVTKPAFERI